MLVYKMSAQYVRSAILHSCGVIFFALKFSTISGIPTLIFRYLDDCYVPQVELFVHIGHDLVVDFGLNDSLNFDIHKVIERVDVLLEQSSDFQERRH